MTVSLQRCKDPDILNALANDPAIRPFIGGDVSHPLDLSHAIANDLNIALIGEHGGFLMAWSAPNVFEVHTMVRLEGRGEWAAEAATLARDAMFDIYAADKLWTRIEEGMDNVMAYAEKAGMTLWGYAPFDLGGGTKNYAILEMEQG